MRYEINEDVAHGGLFRCIKNNSVIFSFFDKTVLRHEENVWYEA